MTRRRGFGVLSHCGDTKTDWVKTQMWAAPIQIREYYKKFQEILQTDFRPQAFFRLGYAPKIIPNSPRLYVQGVFL